jgi:glycosyltransferase involved in cell wall biosynthesis
VAERRIAVDARPLCHPGTGIYRYTMELLSRMCRSGGDWFLYSPQRYATAGLDLPNVHHRVAGMPSVLRAGQLSHALFPLWARRDRVDVFWGPRHQLPPLLPRRVRTAVTIHDMVFRDHGDTMRFPGRQIENFFTPRALARADVIAVVSQFTLQRLEHHFPQYAHKVVVVPGASILQGTVAAGDLVTTAGEGRYFLFVGTLEPRKNLPRLLRAFRRFVTDCPDALPLKIAGGAGWGGQDIARLVCELDLTERVYLLGKVDDSELRDLYRGAYVLLMPSLYEGFGLPIVEALSTGVPVITSENSAMSEVAGAAGYCVNPHSEDAILQAMRAVAGDSALYSKLRAGSSGEAARYDWDRSAAAMARVLIQ